MSFKKISLLMVALTTWLLLVACGDSPTSTPVPTATPVPPTATAVPAVAAPLTAATGGGAGTGSPAAASNGNTTNLPTPANATLIKIDANAVQAILKSSGVPGDLVNSLQFSVYASDDDADKVAADYGKVLTSGGYASALGSVNGSPFTNQNGTYLGLVSKDATEGLVAIQPATADFASSLATAGISADAVKSFNDAVKGKKTFILVLNGKGILQALFSSAGGASPAATPTK